MDDVKDALILVMSEEINNLRDELTNIYRIRIEARRIKGMRYLCIKNLLYTRYYAEWRLEDLKIIQKSPYEYVYSYAPKSLHDSEKHRCIRTPGNLFWECEMPRSDNPKDTLLIHKDDFNMFLDALRGVNTRNFLELAGYS